jgi:SAM-dependent methyltransferase
MSAAARWRQALAEWAIPREILKGADSMPWTLPPEVFARRTRRQIAHPTGPSYARSTQALHRPGSVLDVGAGAGAASLPLATRTTGLTAVDESAGMLAALATLAPAARLVTGRWPDVAADVPPADLVVCHHVFYNVPDLTEFALALTDHARRRVVVELTGNHPLAVLNPYFERLHGLSRPKGPTAADAVAVLREAGLAPKTQRWLRPAITEYDTFDELVDATRRRLCLPATRRDELVALMREYRADSPAPRELTTVWWEP